MATNHRRYSANRRSFEEQQNWRSEKEPTFMWPAAPTTPPILENPAFDFRVCADCHLSPSDCACTCPNCGVASYRTCDVCREAHALTVEREQLESLQMSEMLLAQMRMAGL